MSSYMLQKKKKKKKKKKKQQKKKKKKKKHFNLPSAEFVQRVVKVEFCWTNSETFKPV